MRPTGTSSKTRVRYARIVHTARGFKRIGIARYLTRLGRRPLTALGLTLIALGAVLSACSSSRPADRVHILTWKGDVNPVMARYIDRGIDQAESSSARAVLLRLDTPGGASNAMRDIVQRIEAARVPVIVYVSPSGARAASAGTFITPAATVAAMAPNTSIGAATPINSDGSDIEGALGRKVMNDSVSYIRGIAQLRGRNADWAEQAVRDAVSVNQDEAVSLNVVDFTASSVDDVLKQADGRRVQVATAAGGMQDLTLRTADAATSKNDTTFFENVLDVIATPDLAFLLLTIGGLALLAEIFHPTFIAGIIGVISLVLAYFALGELPTNWAGVALVLFGFVLIGAEIFVAGFGALGIGGIISLILGGLFLMSGNGSGLHVSRWLIFAFIAPLAFMFLLFITTIVRLRRMPAVTGRESLLGKKGTARTALEPKGIVSVEGERWEATAEDAPLPEGTPIVVVASEGLRLRVRRDPASIRLLPPAGRPLIAPPGGDGGEGPDGGGPPKGDGEPEEADIGARSR
jgi:membrane-bound serine protease (ClpP class)